MKYSVHLKSLCTAIAACQFALTEVELELRYLVGRAEKNGVGIFAHRASATQTGGAELGGIRLNLGTR